MPVNVVHKGELICEITCDESNYNVITSVRTEEYPSPMDLLIEALGACMVSNIAYSVEGRMEIDTKNISCRLEKIMQDKPVHRLVGVKINVKIAKTEKLTAKDKLIIEGAAKACPVKNSLREDIDFQIEFEYK